MNTSYPDDADGDALRIVEEHGADMSRPMKIEFSIGVPDITVARSLVELISPLGYEPSIFKDDEDGSVSIYCARTMLATYDGVVSAQDELNRICKPHGAECDGWITPGNKQDH